jgi:hypothetical protein
MLPNSSQLTVLIGPGIPVPPPQPVTEALQRVEVNTSLDRSGFQLTFAIGKTSPLQLLLMAGYLDPMITRVVIMVTYNGMPQVLMDGIITRQELSPSNEPGKSTLTVTGEDLSILMDVVEMKLAYPAMPDAVQILAILAKYAAFGIIPAVIPPPVITVKSPTTGFDQQTGTDRSYIQGKASDCGYVFFVEPGPSPLTSTAYFGPDFRIPVPQRALSVNSDWDTNVESLSFSLDGLAKRVLVMFVLDPITKKIPIPVPVPNISPIHPPLGVRLTPPAKIEFSDDTASLAPDEAAKRAFGYMRRGSDAITGSGSLDVARYGSILRSRMLVGVRGAGLAYDGLYYVNGVTHSIKPGEYKQSFQLSRDGLITSTPVVLP